MRSFVAYSLPSLKVSSQTLLPYLTPLLFRGESYRNTAKRKNIFSRICVSFTSFFAISKNLFGFFVTDCPVFLS